MIIQKFGGSHFTDAKPFINFLNILNNSTDRTVIVISALGKTTRLLQSAAYSAELHNREEWERDLDEIEKFHNDLICKLNLSKDVINNFNEFMINKIDSLRQYFTSIEVLEELTPRTLDNVLAYGEEISLFIFANYLAANSIHFSEIDAREIITTDDNFNDANPNLEKIQQNINEKLIPLFDNTSIILTQGFIGSNENHETTTMGFESSNLTAVLLAYSLNAKEIIIWTNVEGIHVADPNLVGNARFIPYISFADANLSASYGNKLFYTKMLQICEKNNIHIYYKSIFNPDGNSTILQNEHTSSIPMMNILDGLSQMSYNGIHTSKISLSNEEVYPEFFRNFKLFTHNPENIKLLLVSNNNISFWTDLHLGHFSIPKTLINEGQSIIYILNINPISFLKFVSDNSEFFSRYEFTMAQIQKEIYAIALDSEISREVSNKINEYLLSLPE
ncbi:hypothetical protein LLG34_00125 [bacterium]|nr:hypothetical protein [bacterium]